MKEKSCDKKQAAEIFSVLDRAWPDARCELEHNNAFQLLIAVVLSAQTTDRSVNKSLAPLLARSPDFGAKDLVALGEQEFHNVIRSLGLARTKAKHCLQIARLLMEHHGETVPLCREELEKLPGVGRKTANVVLNVLGGLPTMAVDTHVERVAVRLGLAPKTKNRLKIEQSLLTLVPKEYATKAHHLLIFHGRYHCKARSPLCATCPVERLCAKQGLAPQLLSQAGKTRKRDLD